MLAEIVTYVIVAGAGCCACWQLMPGSLRSALAARVPALAQRLGLSAAPGDAIGRPASVRHDDCSRCGGCGHKPPVDTQRIIVHRHAGGR